MSLYHWGSVYPWGENELPEGNKFLEQLTGQYSGFAGDDSPLPDFYSDYGILRGKPIAITETAAFYRPELPGSTGEEIKAKWWTQIFLPDLAVEYGQIKMINWFEWSKQESEVQAIVDWTVTRDPELLVQFTHSLPPYLRYAGEDC